MRTDMHNGTSPKFGYFENECHHYRGSKALWFVYKIWFHEIYFSIFQVSFPAGIVQIVANNPNPAQLSFKIKNADLLESIVPNTKLINPSEMLSTPNGKVFEFKMDALKELLKVQSEINPNAAYFNIDLLKYQVKI